MLQRPTTEHPEQIVARLNLQKVESAGRLNDLCARCLEDLPAEVEVYRGGNERVLNKMVGYVRRLSKGTADPAAVAVTLQKLLAKA